MTKDPKTERASFLPVILVLLAIGQAVAAWVVLMDKSDTAMKIAGYLVLVNIVTLVLIWRESRNEHSWREFGLAVAFVAVFLTLFISGIRAGTQFATTERSPETVGEQLDAFLTWREPRYHADTLNPYRRPLLTRPDEVVAFVNQNFRVSEKVSLPWRLISMLGEIGSPASFELLVEEYRYRPSAHTAISIGSCLSAENIESLFADDENTTDYQEQLRNEIFTSFSRSMALPVEMQTRMYFEANLEQIVEHCRKTTVPVLG